MLEIQNNLYKRSIKKKLTKNNLVNKNYNCCRIFKQKIYYSYNLKDPNNDISKHLKKIFMHFLRYNVQNIDLIKVIF